MCEGGRVWAALSSTPRAVNTFPQGSQCYTRAAVAEAQRGNSHCGAAKLSVVFFGEVVCVP